MATLRDSWDWIGYDKFDTYREAFIGWFKNTSPIITLHNNIARSKGETALLNVTLTSLEVTQFSPTPETIPDDDEATRHDNNNTKQRSNSGNKKSNDFDDYHPLVLPAFDLSRSTVSYRNGKLRVNKQRLRSNTTLNMQTF